MTTTAQVTQFAAARRQLRSGLTGLFTDLLAAPVIMLARRSWWSGGGGEASRTAAHGQTPMQNRLAG